MDLARPPRQSASYGQACLGCSKAKCRCVRRLNPVRAKCDRCQRLTIPCQPSQALRRRGGRPPNRTAQLEDKLDDLVTLLRSQAELKTTHKAPKTPPADIRTAVTQQPSSVHHDQPQIEALGGPPVSDPVYATPSTLSSNFDMGELDPLEDEEHLQFFQAVHLPAFPLVFLPPESSAAQLRIEKPYLWLAIQSICCKSASRRAALEHQLCQIFAQRALVQSERSLDLISSHMVHTACGVLYSSRQALHMASTMAAVLVQDLALDQYPGFERSGVRNYIYGVKPPQANQGNSTPSIRQSSRQVRTNEERRAVLACYCLCSSNSQKLGTPPMRWTPHMDDCLHHLASQPQCGNDEVLVIITKCSRILDDILAASSWVVSDGEVIEQPEHVTWPSTVPIKALKGMLDEVRHQIRPAVMEKRVVKFWLYFTEVMIYDLALHLRPQAGYSTSSTTSLNFTRAGYLSCCLRAINLFLENFFSFKPKEYYGLHLHYWLYFLRCIRMVYRLLLTDDPAWDRATIRDCVDLMGTMQRGIDTSLSVMAAVGFETDGSDLFSSIGGNLRHAKSIWMKTLEQVGVFTSATPPSPVLNNHDKSSLPQSANSEDLILRDIYDDSWMGDIFSWNQYPWGTEPGGLR